MLKRARRSMCTTNKSRIATSCVVVLQRMIIVRGQTSPTKTRRERDKTSKNQNKKPTREKRQNEKKQGGNVWAGRRKVDDYRGESASLRVSCWTRITGLRGALEVPSTRGSSRGCFGTCCPASRLFYCTRKIERGCQTRGAG